MTNASRFLLSACALVLLGAGCAPAAAPRSETSEERSVRPELPPTPSPEAPPAPQPVPPTPVTTALFSGRWFDVRYPSDFTPRKGAVGCHMDECDSAFFASPDGSVEFYVFSPLWSGNASPDTALAANEKIVSEDSKTEGDRTVRWWTKVALDGSYTFAFVETRDENAGSPVNHVFGIRYADQAAYAKHRDAYVAFKSSLIQYAD